MDVDVVELVIVVVEVVVLVTVVVVVVDVVVTVVIEVDVVDVNVNVCQTELRSSRTNLSLNEWINTAVTKKMETAMPTRQCFCFKRDVTRLALDLFVSSMGRIS